MNSLINKILNWVPLFPIVLAVVLFIIIKLGSNNQFKKELESTRNWLTTEAEILSADCLDQVALSSGRMVTRTGYSIPEIRYRYTVENKVYTNNRLSITPISNLREAAAATVINHFEDAESIKIYYNPEDPSDSVVFRI